MKIARSVFFSPRNWIFTRKPKCTEKSHWMHQKTLNSHELYTNVYSVIDHYMINILRKYIPVILELPRGTLIRGGTFIWGSTLIMYRRVKGLALVKCSICICGLLGLSSLLSKTAQGDVVADYVDLCSAALNWSTLWQLISVSLRLFQSFIVLGKNEYLYVSIKGVFGINCWLCFREGLLLKDMNSVGGMATALCSILNIIVRRWSLLLLCRGVHPRLFIMSVTLL